MTRISFCLLFLCLIIASGPAAWAGPKTISLNKAQALFSADKAVFLDARYADEYVEAHIRGAVSLPVEYFGEVFPHVQPLVDQNATVITYCDGEFCTMGHELAEMLEDKGYTDVYVLHDGWRLWNERGLPVTSGRNP
jgi:rhodanese-related sulfurtransferase